MKRMISKLQKEIQNIQDTLLKEGNEFLEKLKILELKGNVEAKKNEIEKIFFKKIKKVEPAYHKFINELKHNAKKAGIDIDKLEKELKFKADSAKKTLQKQSHLGKKQTLAVKNTLKKTLNKVKKAKVAGSKKKVAAKGAKSATKAQAAKKASSSASKTKKRPQPKAD